MVKPFQASRPSALWYLVPVVITSVSVAVFIASLGSVGREVRSDVAAMPRVAFPEGGAIELPREGPYTVYYETRSVVDGREVEGERPRQRISLHVTTPAGETEEATNIHWREEGAYDAKEIYDLPRYAGFAAWKYTAPRAGAYRFSAAFSDQPTGSNNESRASQGSGEASDLESPRFAVAVGNLGLQEHLSSWTGLFGAAAMVAVAMVVAVAMAIWVYAKRNPGRWSRSSGQPHTAG